MGSVQREITVCSFENKITARDVQEFAKGYGMDISELKLQESDIAEQERVRAKQWFSMPTMRVQFVDSLDQLREMAAILSGVKLVGLDVEWKPDGVDGGANSPASILQIAARHPDTDVIWAFVLDLPALHVRFDGRV